MVINFGVKKDLITDRECHEIIDLYVEECMLRSQPVEDISEEEEQPDEDLIEEENGEGEEGEEKAGNPNEGDAEEE